MDRSMKKDLILHGDVYACLDWLEDNSVSVAITSPPYWQQRDYGFEGQIGREKTLEEYIGRLTKIFSKLRQKLKKDGIFFLNIGDKYYSKYGKSHLLQIPYRLAYHMVKDGWYLEDILIWYKPNHMPSSVKDRFVNTYEPVFVFSKSKSNIYRKNLSKVLEVELQQTKWKHTAVYPEKLVENLLNYVDLKNGDIVIDPFAGTGTTAVAVEKFKNNNSLFYKEIYSIMIEKSKDFIDIIQERSGIKNVIKIKDIPYKWKKIVEDEFPSDISPKLILNNKYGEVYISKDFEEFISILKGITTEESKKFHREDALYFIGIKDFNLEALYYIHKIFDKGFVLRNMIIISNKGKWYPIFMIAKDTKKVKYKFYIDRIRIKPKYQDKRDWGEIDFIGYKVKDNISKEKKEGTIVKILDTYDDNFPKIVLVKWHSDITSQEDFLTCEFVLHPENDEVIMESMKFICPNCNSELEEPFDPLGENICPVCKLKLWKDTNTIPLIEEPEIVLSAFEKCSSIEIQNNLTITFNEKTSEITTKSMPEMKSKYISIERLNWGASPGARKIMNGEYFSKVRLYKLDHSISAQYLNILRKEKELSIKDISNKFPENYHHTVGHWFRKDMGGCIPLPSDIEKLKIIFNREYDPFLASLKRTALKLQTVKSSVKGKNPGDFIKNMDENQVKDYLKLLYIPSSEYIKILSVKTIDN